MSSSDGAQYDPGPGGGAALNRGARGLAQKIKDWTDARIAAALVGRSGLTSLKINGAQIGLRQHLDVQMTGATGEDHPELDLARMVLPSGGSLLRCSVVVNHASFSGSVTLAFASTEFDPDGWADFTNNQIVVPATGDYLIHSFISWGASSGPDLLTGTFRLLSFSFSPVGDPHFAQQQTQTDASHDQYTQETLTFRHLPAGATIKVRAQHDATGPLIVSGGSSHPNDLTVLKLG